MGITGDDTYKNVQNEAMRKMIFHTAFIILFSLVKNPEASPSADASGPQISSEICVDILFILDESEPLITIHDEHAFDDLKQYLIELANYFDITVGPRATRFAVVGFGTFATLQLPFDNYTNGTGLKQALTDLQLVSLNNPEDGARNTSGGLTLARQYLKQSKRPNLNQIAALIAYYAHDKGDDPATAAAVLRSDGVPLFVAAIKDGDYTPEYAAEMDEIAGKASYLFPVEYYTNLWNDSITDQLIGQAVADSACALRRCPADVVYLIDQSTSITSANYYENVVPFMVNLTDALDISQYSSHLAMVQFSSPNQTEVAFYLDTNYSADALKDLIKAAPYLGGTTAMEKALNLTYSDILTAKHGARLNDTNVTTVIIIITDGVPTDTAPEGSSPTAAVSRLVNEGAAMFAVGTGSLMPGYLFELTGNHTDINNVPDRVFQVSEFTELYTILENLTSATACLPQLSNFCDSVFDVVYVVEDSPKADDSQVGKFLSFITSALNVDGGVRVAMQLYNENSDVKFQLNTYDSSDDMVQILMDMKFTKNATAPQTGRALNYTLNQMLTSANGERSCVPDIVVVLSYSKSADSADFIARKLRYQGSLVVAIAQGDDGADDLRGIASPGLYFHVDNSYGLSYYLAEAIVAQFCNYTPGLDVSEALDEATSKAIYQYIIAYLEPYKFSYGVHGIQAALLTYEADIVETIHLNDTEDLQTFEKKLAANWPMAGIGSGHSISKALETTSNEIFDPRNGYRRDAPHIVILFTLGCYTDTDPSGAAASLRQQAELFVVTSTVSAELLLDLASDSDHIFQLGAGFDGMLGIFPELSWQFTCDAWTGTFGIDFFTDIDWDPAFAVEGSPQRLGAVKDIYNQLTDAYTESALHATVIDVIDFQETPAGSKTQVFSQATFSGYTRLLSDGIVKPAIEREFGKRDWSSIEVKEFAPRPVIGAAMHVRRHIYK